ncbi:DUF3696 domain-containing protein [Acidovorax sp. Be4]|uniref:DUF3696 domain-containing protein n=1 Tax=Acidovorax bellezanensis TaxID=2976702 RepID=A0ABT2PI42_9BURK|nr:DUF3696 domain-containing protein [Acidovorax sp. Be4]MCT9810150.1 DUF3696 domain-containing protein [Acidovorax sp. Be4]
MLRVETKFGDGMAILKSLGLKNLRSLKNIDSAPISPITVLIGKNSVGKSTFARVFPLIRQSVERKKKSPILWFGEYVDFGSLSQAVHRGEKELSFKFKLNFDESDHVGEKNDRPDYWLSDGSRLNYIVNEATVELSLCIGGSDNSAYPKSLFIEIEDFNFRVIFSESNDVLGIESVYVNDKKITLPSGYKAFPWQGDVLPNVFFGKLEHRNNSNGESEPFYVVARNPWKSSIVGKVSHWVHGNVSSNTIRKIASQIRLGSVDKIAKSVAEIDGPNSWRDLSYYGDYSKGLYCKSFQSSIIEGVFPEIIEKIDGALKRYFSSVRYIKPLRATAERYYRRQDLAIHEIDPEGRNLPVFLDSLSHKAQLSFREWISRSLKIDVFPEREGEQIKVMAKGENDDKPFNITDMGVGISQVLPIAAQLWAINGRHKDLGSSSAVVIEQPELHLHPEYQARLADVFVAAVKNNNGINGKTSLIIETHSQHIVNRLGRLVEEKMISPEDVTILLFEPSESEQKSTSVRISTFDEEGVLQNWPFGFFEPGETNVA